MNPDPTTTVSLDYLVKLSDDGKQPDQLPGEIIIIPPTPNGRDSLRNPATKPDVEPQR